MLAVLWGGLADEHRQIAAAPNPPRERAWRSSWSLKSGMWPGITHKILYSQDIVMLLYLINFLMVGTDTTARISIYRRREKNQAEKARGAEKMSLCLTTQQEN